MKPLPNPIDEAKKIKDLRMFGFELCTFLNCNDCGYRVPTRVNQFSHNEVYFLIGDCPYCKSEDTSVMLDPRPILPKASKDNRS